MVQSYQRLGELLVHRGAVNSLQLSIALADQRISNRRLGEILVERGFTTETEVAACLAAQYGYPLADLKDFVPNRDALGCLRPEEAVSLRALPLELNDAGLVVAISDPIDVLSTDRLAALVRHRLQVRIAPESALTQTIRTVYGLEEPIAQLFEHADKAPTRFESLQLKARTDCSSLLEGFDSELGRTVHILVTSATGKDGLEHYRQIRAAAHAPVEGLNPIFDSLLHNGFRWTVLQRMSGDSLERLLKVRGPRSVAQAAEWTAKCAEVVDQVHRNGADCAYVCPSNIYVRQSGPYLAPLALRPERYACPNAQFDSEFPMQQSVYALGMLLKDCLCGLEGQITAGLPAPMQDILTNCLADDPAKRYRTAIEVASALKTYNWHALSNPLARNTSAERDHLLDTLLSGPKASEGSPNGGKPGLWKRIISMKGKNAA